MGLAPRSSKTTLLLHHVFFSLHPIDKSRSEDATGQLFVENSVTIQAAVWHDPPVQLGLECHNFIYFL